MQNFLYAGHVLLISVPTPSLLADAIWTLFLNLLVIFRPMIDTTRILASSVSSQSYFTPRRKYVLSFGKLSTRGLPKFIHIVFGDMTKSLTLFESFLS